MVLECCTAKLKIPDIYMGTGTKDLDTLKSIWMGGNDSPVVASFVDDGIASMTCRIIVIIFQAVLVE